MSARLLSSALWIPLLLIPPLRLLLERGSELLWPTAHPFPALAQVHPRWVPFIVVVALGYLLTCGLIRFVLREVDGIGDLQGTPTLRAPAIGATVTWVILVALVGQLTVPLSLVAVLTVLPFLKTEKKSPPPSPDPPSPPTPPDPLPEPEPSPEPSPTPPEEEEGFPEEGEEQASEEENLREDDDWYYRSYSWYFDEEPYRARGETHQFSLDLAIRKSHYEELRARDHRVPNDQLVELINEQLDHERISELASKIRQISNEQGLDDLAEIHLVMAFTLSMPYAFDEKVYGQKYPKFPVEMLVDQEGDCTDFSALCGALLYRLGHDAAYVLMTFTDKEAGHAALGVRNPVPQGGAYVYRDNPEKKYYYCEVTPTTSATTETTTDVQWWLGMEFPDNVKNFMVYPIG